MNSINTGGPSPHSLSDIQSDWKDHMVTQWCIETEEHETANWWHLKINKLINNDNPF